MSSVSLPMPHLCVHATWSLWADDSVVSQLPQSTHVFKMKQQQRRCLGEMQLSQPE